MSFLWQPLEDNEISRLVQTFYADFISSLSPENLLQLTLAAELLCIEPLLELCCAQISSCIKGKKPEETRVLLNISNEFSPEEEELFSSAHDSTGPGIWCRYTHDDTQMMIYMAYVWRCVAIIYMGVSYTLLAYYAEQYFGNENNNLYGRLIDE